MHSFLKGAVKSRMHQQRYLNLLLRLLLVLAAAAVAAVKSANVNDADSDRCRACDRLAAAFQRGLARTARDNFGGGNTNWEETRLGSYALSETRLVDITERLCKDEASGSTDSCHAMLERVEEDIERWWCGPFKSDPATADLREFLCVNRTSHCCPHGRWGPECAQCPSCSGHGDCNGNGTKIGTGVCDCHPGYAGVECSECAERHFRSSSVTDGVAAVGDCLACHPGCQSACIGPLATQCDACAEGYRLSEGSDDNPVGGGCTDVDECAAVPPACQDQPRRFCENTPGSYRCRDCDPACSACSGPGPAGCTACAVGYEPPAGDGRGCQDVNECSPDSPHCAGPYERCVNLPGSYRCDCQPGYHRQAGNCVPKPVAAMTGGGKAAAAGKKQRGGDSSKKGRPPKLIWTVAYTLEFAKFFAAIIGLGIFAVALKGRPVFVGVAACLSGWYLCKQSSVLDRVYLRARG